jgi:hypothetical protein
MFFFNNCNTFDHAKGYGIPDAFFDLATTGFQQPKPPISAPRSMRRCDKRTRRADSVHLVFIFACGEEAVQKTVLGGCSVVPL